MRRRLTRRIEPAGLHRLDQLDQIRQAAGLGLPRQPVGERRRDIEATFGEGQHQDLPLQIDIARIMGEGIEVEGERRRHVALRLRHPAGEIGAERRRHHGIGRWRQGGQRRAVLGDADPAVERLAAGQQQPRHRHRQPPSPRSQGQIHAGIP
jgi:hypothetical protein